MKTKIAILHYMPLEYYPPITNFIQTIIEQDSRDLDILVLTCKNNRNRLVFDIDKQSGNHQLKIKRYPFPRSNEKRLIRLLKYLLFNISSLLKIIIFNPKKIIYFESYSAFPVYIYLKYFKQNCEIFIHYHEYESKAAYEKMMKTVQLYHLYEKTHIYSKAVWISQTNKDRLRLFHADHPTVIDNVLKVLPNYPPRAWHNYISKPISKNIPCPLKIIHIGSLSFHNTYIYEFVEWILLQKGAIQFDIYSYNIDSDVKLFLKSHCNTSINFYENGIEYYLQPTLLNNYDVAIILHKAHNENYRFNAPNKLFESLACNLDVWYPKELEGVTPYNTHNTYPQVIPIDFSKLDHFDWKKALRHNQMEYKPFDLYCEEAYKTLIEQLTE